MCIKYCPCTKSCPPSLPLSLPPSLTLTLPPTLSLSLPPVLSLLHSLSLPRLERFLSLSLSLATVHAYGRSFAVYNIYRRDRTVTIYGRLCPTEYRGDVIAYTVAVSRAPSVTARPPPLVTNNEDILLRVSSALLHAHRVAPPPARNVEITTRAQSTSVLRVTDAFATVSFSADGISERLAVGAQQRSINSRGQRSR